MKLDPRHLVQIAAIVEAGGMTEGAALIGSTQPALSRTVAMIEARLRAPLFHRGRRPIEPTPLGLMLAEQGAAVRLATERASRGVEEFRQGAIGAIRVGGTPFFMDALISGMIASFQASYPGVRVDQSYGYTAELIAQVRGGRLELALCPVEVLDEDADLMFEPILSGRNVVACRAGHPLTAERPLRATALLDYPWIEPPPGSPLQADLRSAVLMLGVERLPIGYSGGSLGSIVNHMRGSDSLSVLPHSVVFALGETSGLTALPIALEHPPRALGLLRQRGPGRPPAADRFAAHVKARFAELRVGIARHEKALFGAGGCRARGAEGGPSD